MSDCSSARVLCDRSATLPYDTIAAHMKKDASAKEGRGDNTARPVTQIFMAASNWLYNFAITQATPHMFDKMGYGVYLFFASCMVCSVGWIYFSMPETKGGAG